MKKPAEAGKFTVLTIVICIVNRQCVFSLHYTCLHEYKVICFQ
jgi:hypothetical protein